MSVEAESLSDRIAEIGTFWYIVLSFGVGCLVLAVLMTWVAPRFIEPKATRKTEDKGVGSTE